MSSSRKFSSGTVVKRADCPRCRRSYEYDLSRTTMGSSKGAATQPEADAQALQDAEAKLKTALANDCDLVSCPSCGAITKEMKAYRMKRFGDGFACMGVGVGISLAVFLVMHFTGRLYLVAAGLGVLCLLLGLAILGIGIKEALAPKKGKLDLNG